MFVRVRCKLSLCHHLDSRAPEQIENHTVIIILGHEGSENSGPTDLHTTTPVVQCRGDNVRRARQASCDGFY